MGMLVALGDPVTHGHGDHGDAWARGWGQWWHMGMGSRRHHLPPICPHRRDTSVDESYEWDAEVTLATDLLAALQLYRTAEPPRPLSTIALRDLERQSEFVPKHGDAAGSPTAGINPPIGVKGG